MNTRNKFSVVLLCLGIILAVLPLTGNRSFTVKPNKLLSEAVDERSYISVDQVARLLVSEDTSIQLIDLRSQEEFKALNIPGSINVPYKDFLNNDPGSFLGNGNLITILYSNGDFDSNSAFIIAGGMNYRNIYVMKGGLNEWFNKVMNSSFKGDRITARENALFETRSRARKLFTEMNSLPDSLKKKFIENKHLTARKLDGGCE